MMNKVKKAFTIFEVLLAMTVISMIAMIMMGSLSTNTSNHTLYTALNKNYTYMQQVFQAIPMLQVKGKIPPGDANADMFMRALVITSKCIGLKPDAKKMTSNNKFSDYISGYKPSNVGIESYTQFALDASDKTTVILKNNVFISRMGSDDNTYIVLDTNGKKLPNRTGLDIFFFKIIDGALVAPNNNCHINTDVDRSGGCAAIYLRQGKLAGEEDI